MLLLIQPNHSGNDQAGSAVYGERVHVAAKASSLLENLLLWSLSQKGMLEPVMREEDLAALAAEAIPKIYPFSAGTWMMVSHFSGSS